MLLTSRESPVIDLALETRVGSAIWITRTKDLIDRIAAARASA
jgi:hypothetical protein